ncbi:calmodulin-binding transcription activator 3-like isoform X3 [Cucumis melo var. makuwa]|uniref:Calmodulin-binding transcription activator 3-like isoform X3 n=1 Tax=Cucumis melo var. makuwa TaxID=1194695 RepID=A0A5D3BAV0_CUCMM|nr:calmodulin-binding transcription activator 3-like isoform X3 [Cucumis melo var. makuwa]
MADNRRYVPIQQLDLVQILQEAQKRWLRPAEICEILRNYKKFQLAPDPPVQPPAGSLFLFDRKALRYFRKDGHRWRKKKDGKTVKEAHEKLKAGSVDVLHCYYAHGEDNENFQRRSYWMLDGQLEHIVLVHYREVKEGCKSGMSRVSVDPGLQAEGCQGVSTPFFLQEPSLVGSVHASCPFNLSQTVPSGNGGMDSSGRNKSGVTSHVHQVFKSSIPPASFPKGDVSVLNDIFLLQSVPLVRFILRGWRGRSLNLLGLVMMKLPCPMSIYEKSPQLSWQSREKCMRDFLWEGDEGKGSHLGIKGTHRNPWKDVALELPSLPFGLLHCGLEMVLDSSKSSSRSSDLCGQEIVIIQSATTDSITHKPTDARFDSSGLVENMVNSESGLIADSKVPAVKAVSQRFVQIEKTTHDNLDLEGLGELRKLDSFGRWMDKEIGRDCNDSLMTLDSRSYWCGLDAGNDEKEDSSLSHHMQLDVNSLEPSLSQEQLFSIFDFSPDWTYSGNVTKVLVVGSFLGSNKLPVETQWGCMFGEVEVSAEVLTNNVLRCRTPPLHAPGRIPFYVTCCNRLACSEVREFEYREKPPTLSVPNATKCAPEDELWFQMRLIRLLNLGSEENLLKCSIEKCEKCQIIGLINSSRSDVAKWTMTEGSLKSDGMNHRDYMIQSLLEDKLCKWLAYKVHDGTMGTHVLDDEGLGVIHLAAALGYAWAIGSIIASGLSPNFRDSNGRTALHWASYFGREETVTTLVSLGVSPGAVDDPTSGFPRGQTAADLASSRGHKGIAGYLAEADLKAHSCTLTDGENFKDNIKENANIDEAIETVDVVPSQLAEDELLSLKGSLAAVRKSVNAAALIHAAFRARSFRHKQLMGSDKGMIHEDSPDLVALGILNKAEKIHYEDYLHVAAVRIQQNYRGWKGRREFLKIRNRIVKIQAHVRGHQVRKEYRKVIWSVSIVEKAILRWRRKRVGLRGFKAEGAMGEVVTPHPKMDKSDEYEFLRIGRQLKYADVEKALSRVKSMARSPEARRQYMRLVANFNKFKINDEETSSSNQGGSSQEIHKEKHMHSFAA